jgi:ElaB/YqjD/DUF883 family membrane-anchored ribosome-binding protein
MTPDTDSQFAAIRQKVQQLLQKYRALEKENARLKNALQEEKDKGNSYASAIQSLTQQGDALRLSKGSFSAGEKAELKKRIDGYLKEIDECLLLLNRE